MSNSSIIPNLTEDIIYCPKCGTINSFNKSKSGKLLNLFCSRCGIRLNDLWDEFSNGNIKPAICFYCDEITFKGEVYCIACGAKQKKVRGIIYSMLSEIYKDSGNEYYDYTLRLAKDKLFLRNSLKDNYEKAKFNNKFTKTIKHHVPKWLLRGYYELFLEKGNNG